MYRCITRSLLNSGKTYEAHTCKCEINNERIFRNRSISYCRQNYYLNKKLTEGENADNTKNKEDEHNLPAGLATKYKVFRDEDAPIIFDVNEERKRIELGELNIEEEHPDPYEGINLTHGISGVFEIEDLVELLRRDNAKQIFVATVPKEYTYVDYIVVVTGKSIRHMHALATFVRKVFKLKKHKHENIPKIEGENSKEWMALDLGNIALHIFSSEARAKYDLETLWSVGSEFDDISNQKDNELDIMYKYKSFLKELQPAE